ncbi:FAD-dependent oxidoreductase [Spiroplasma platyhelix]|uniref:FAD-dependent oxidoreductase n=1 Tax=Spiroplasma platyhelix PALS-1 TaxID=1276218 RepID=A0A846U0C5_9MOLU|nr:FAD-dependent oxidoreductase [Spiroplasma platyhelix]MBE4704104.1 NADH peroxidase [Spiroplasma platyhelix PALS-1]NKE38474.1 FAD-dependent oxidoreductase [Spiroplasma platyhelix PALS-1]UJB29362.1 NADH oxidase [Spiroplasma platyhelix PALS-1]
MKIAIIGAGAAGMGVASKLSREHEKLNIHVFQNHNYISLGACGIPYFIANDFKKQALLNARTVKDFKNEQYKSKIHFHLNHNVNNINPEKNELTYENKKKEQKTFKYKYLVIATGAKPNVFSPFDLQSQPKNLFTVINKEDAINIKAMIKNAQKIAIIGGSFIGLEMAETCLKLKKSVTIIEVKDRLMANVFDQEFSPLIYNEITGTNKVENKPKKSEHYAKVLLNTTVNKLNVKDNVIISLETNNSKQIDCDLVLLASGFTPNTSFLTKNNIKLAKNNAIVINEYGEVLIDNTDSKDKNVRKIAYENIFSGGDCATIINQTNQTNNYLPLATSANKIARIIANNIMYPYKKEVWPGTLGASIIRVKHLELARVGIKDDYWKPENIASIFIKNTDTPTYFPSSKPLYLKLFYDKVSYQILGAEMAGYNKAVLRIDALSTAIWNKMDVRDLQYLDLVYAPPFATTTDIIQIAARKIK